MKCIYKFIVTFFVIVIGCKSALDIDIKKEDKFDISFLKSLLIYPNMKISNFNIYDYEYLKKKYDFKILKEEPKGIYFIDLVSFNENINYLKKLYDYYKKLYKVILAYSSAQGIAFKTEIFNYLDNRGIKKNFPLRLNFFYLKKDFYVLIKKKYFNMLLEDKKALMVANQKLEDIVVNFLK